MTNVFATGVILFSAENYYSLKPKYAAGDEWALIEAKTNKATFMNKFMLQIAYAL